MPLEYWKGGNSVRQPHYQWVAGAKKRFPAKRRVGAINQLRADVDVTVLVCTLLLVWHLQPVLCAEHSSHVDGNKRATDNVRWIGKRGLRLGQLFRVGTENVRRFRSIGRDLEIMPPCTKYFCVDEVKPCCDPRQQLFMNSCEAECADTQCVGELCTPGCMIEPYCG
ncbi:hypothetical protein CBR_g84849 [Chara braunii]|uniref:Uncharacterized protein n=1 Tax=Chara braunii TaxID=69332 RepID=A0A388KAU7_CHABU|nr:hypothetical protein CBR_g84849 [Chara braunii]|eukprot:GBG67185.1 hypothetical protein CBR_g84849 [Chara braunii]